MTPETLHDALGCSADMSLIWSEPLTKAMAEFGIDTPVRQAAFLAQIAHESGLFKWVKEIWGPTEAQKGYEGRKDLGNVHPGDGSRFRGRGLIQITGRANYQQCGTALHLDCVEQPWLLETPENAARSAGWFWNSRNLNALADVGDFERIVRKVNGGLNGLADRARLWEKAKAALGC